MCNVSCCHGRNGCGANSGMLTRMRVSGFPEHLRRDQCKSRGNTRLKLQ